MNWANKKNNSTGSKKLNPISEPAELVTSSINAQPV
jgi:hypothetical protein